MSDTIKAGDKVIAHKATMSPQNDPAYEQVWGKTGTVVHADDRVSFGYEVVYDFDLGENEGPYALDAPGGPIPFHRDELDLVK